VMGPAYVCAAMLLRVDPDSEESQIRVDVMLKALDALDSSDEHEVARTRLRQGWERAASRGGAQPDPGLAGLTVQLVDDTMKLVNFFSPAEWGRAADWADQLEKDLFDPDPDVPRRRADGLGRNDLRALLVAAWYARLGLGKGAMNAPLAAADEQRRLSALAERTRLTCIEVIESNPGGGGGSVPSPPPRGGGSRVLADRPATPKNLSPSHRNVE